jgi:hypothetical protein
MHGNALRAGTNSLDGFPGATVKFHGDRGKGHGKAPQGRHKLLGAGACEGPSRPP